MIKSITNRIFSCKPIKKNTRYLIRNKIIKLQIQNQYMSNALAMFDYKQV